MSASGGKGSNRRPGEGYSEGWDRVFGKKERAVVAAAGFSYADENKLNVKTRVNPDDLFGQGPSLVRVDEAIRIYGTYPNRVWNLQDDGSLLPADGGKPLDRHNLGDTIVLNSKEEAQRVIAFMSGEMTCKNCKHYEETYCNNGELTAAAPTWGYIDFSRMPNGFGCSKWEKKV